MGAGAASGQGIADEITVKRMWWWLFGPLVCLVGGTLYVGVSITWSSIEQARRGASQPWWLIILFDAFIVVVVLGLSWHPVTSILTRFTTDGVVKPTLRGYQRVRWSEIERVEFNARMSGCALTAGGCGSTIGSFTIRRS